MSQNGWRVEPVETFEAWAALAGRWNGLLDASRSRSVFLTYEWLSAWAETYLGPRRRLWILAVYDGDELAGLAPWYLERGRAFPVRYVKFLGSPEAGADHLDVFAKPGSEGEVAEALAAFLRRSKAWDALWLSQIRADSLFLFHWSRVGDETGGRTDTTITTHAPCLRLPGSVEDLEALLTPKRRKQFRQHSQRLAEIPGFAISQARDGELSEKLEAFFKLYGGRGLSLCDRPDILLGFLKRFQAKALGKGWFRMDWYAVGDRLVAGHVHFWYGRTLSGYLIAVDRSFQPTVSLGKLIIWRCLLGSVRAGLEVYDFLRGRETFKFHFAADVRALCLMVSGRTWFIHHGLVLARALKGMTRVVRGD